MTPHTCDFCDRPSVVLLDTTIGRACPACYRELTRKKTPDGEEERVVA